MRETAFESFVVKKVKQSGGLAFKLICPGAAGIPDRLFVFPNGRVVFAEIKRPGRKNGLSPLQLMRIAKLQACGATVWILNDKKEFESILWRFLGGEAK